MRCEADETYVVDFGVGPIDDFNVECDEEARYEVTFETFDVDLDRPVEVTTSVCMRHFDEDDVPGAMYHVRTVEIFDEVTV